MLSIFVLAMPLTTQTCIFTKCNWPDDQLLRKKKILATPVSFLRDSCFTIVINNIALCSNGSTIISAAMPISFTPRQKQIIDIPADALPDSFYRLACGAVTNLHMLPSFRLTPGSRTLKSIEIAKRERLFRHGGACETNNPPRDRRLRDIIQKNHGYLYNARIFAHTVSNGNTTLL